jgi:4-hydroxybenzoate polyprenyltransferase
MQSVRALVTTLRPHQWVKNLFVAAPLVFAKKLTDPAALALAAAAVAAFCALSGAVYAVNDVLDVDKDRAHPTKRRRPIASGALSVRAALGAAALLAAGALGAALAIAPAFGAVAAGYLALNLAYSLRLKDLPYLDVTAIAGGFLLRVLGGAYAVDVPPSPWLLACTALLAAFLGFGKRAHELAQASAGGAENSEQGIGRTRRVLMRYRDAHLKGALWLFGGLTAVAYAFYTQAEHTIAYFGGRDMMYTIPFCVLGIGRFLHLVTRRTHEDSPTDEMLRDAPFMANLALWGLVVLAIIYYR